MVEKQEGTVHINDTGVSSKDDEKFSKEKREVTEYWDISGAMDSTSASATDLKMKLLGTEANMQGGITDINDNVTTLTAENSTTGTLNDDEYCESDKSAIKTPAPRLGDNDNHNCNNNNNNNDILQLVSQNEDTLSKNKVMCKNVDPFLENKGKNNDDCNVSRHQTEDNTVGNASVNDTGPENDVKDTVSENMVTSGIKDDCPEGENKAALSIREEMMLDSECTEERFRIDRKKLEQMLQAASEGRGQSGEAFFQKIMDDTNTFITWPSKLKIGAKSKKDPHIRICGKPDNIKEARHKIMLSLDTKSNRVTIKMDVSHTEHSHVIGKGGNNIKRVMQETGCHIHFPDSNRNTAGEKSNQVSITGHPEGVENARQKIRTLLPIVLQFEIPNTGLPIPDLNSPMIQHLVQVYGISIQFKQRAKVYSTSCTVRGSMDNTEGLKTGLQTLMNHVAGGQLPVTTQIEIAPQHHNYMLTKPGVNVTTITQTTGARIIFPDPSALPKKSTVYINGNIDSVILARHKLMGCLPLLLMFDMKDDLGNPANDATRIAQLMESMDLSINVKSKPRQPSRTVIIKSIESNIYKMFEARANLLGLESSGISRPAQSLSPKLNRNATVTPTPVILLAHSHVPTPTAQTAVIGLTEQKTMTPLSGVVLNGPSYVLTPTVPSNTVKPRPLSTTMHTPSHSPFPAVQGNNISSSGPFPHADDVSPQSYVTSTMSPPNIPLTQPTPLSSDQRRFQVNVTSDVQRRMNQRSGMHTNENISSSALNKRYFPNQTGYSVAINQNGIPRQMSQLDEFTRSQQNLYSELKGLKIPEQGRSFDEKRVLLSPTYDSRSIRTGQLINQSDSRLIPQDQDLRTNMNDRLQRPTGRHYPQGILSDEEYLRQQLGITDSRSRRDSDSSHVLLQNNMNQVPNSVRQPFGQNVRSPDSIGESRASITSDQNSPMSSISDRFNGNSNPRLDSLSSRDINSLSPVSNVSHHRSPPQILLNQNLEGGLDSTGIPDGSPALDDISQTQSAVGEINPGPPPGFEGFTPAGHAPPLKTQDYENLCKLAKKAMENKPVHSEVRTPTDIWSGWGFSKSMPFGMKEELKKLAASKGRFRSNLPTTYENGEIPERNQPSPVDEEGEYNDLDNQVMNRSRMQFAEKGSSNFSAWRRRRLANMNLSLGGNMGLNYMSNAQRNSPQKHSAFTPIQPGESLNRAGSSPKNKPINESVQTSMQMKNVFNSSGNETTLRVPLPEKPKTYDTRMGMSNTPTIQDSLGLGSSASNNTTSKVEPDISDVLNRLGLSKYIPVFQQQEVDYQTFLTLTEPDLKELGITTFGPRKKILLAISDLNKDRDVFCGPITNDSTVHENISDQMLQLQRLQLQQHRDNPQTTSSSRLDPHPLLSSNSRPIFNSQNLQDLDGPGLNRLIEDSKRHHRTNGLWQNSATGVNSNSGHW